MTTKGGISSAQLLSQLWLPTFKAFISSARTLLNLGYSNAQGYTNPLRGCNKEDIDLIIILILRGHGPIIYSSCQL